ncbi:hypothetical protein [Methanobrevibacter curvatus]|uniref:Uncharacterized protein n=1 Tax=Methanobrevibacter curvatus TaxID=49547 RepID=A0A166DHQ3_9EURY|nr:hypothetical protein [Methanobrevibacter curvatus]KZX15613.1 hypothetical protein MBCUR_02470 [Methanobrevibacter curvatus]
MVIESILKSNQIEVPQEILDKIKGKKIVKWKHLDNGDYILNFSEISEECQELAEEIAEIKKEMDNGDFVEMDINDFAKNLGIDL